MSITNYTLAADQANSTVTLADIGGTTEPWEFSVPPGGTLSLAADFAFSSAANTTGLTLSAEVANPFGAERTVLGAFSTEIAVDTALAATAVADGGQVSVASNTTTNYTVTSTASTTTPGDVMFARMRVSLKNFSTNAAATVTLQFASEVGASAVTLLAGSTAVGVIS